LPNCKINNIKMVVFDKDGTLIDIHYYWYSMIEFRARFFIDSIDIDKNQKEKLYKELINNMGIDINLKKMKPEGPVGIKPRSYIVEVVLNTIKQYDNNYTKEMVENIFAKVDEYSKTKLNQIVKLLPNVKDLLNNLKNSNTLITIATTDLTKRAKLAIQALNLESFFDEIVGADLVKRAKPYSDLLDLLLQKFGINKDEIVLIGDSIADLEMAKNAECKFIGVKTGLYNDEFLNNTKYLINDLSEIKVEK